ncbi:MAG TPA: hypothetical protein VMS17_03995, partial [Gemmataceae bacterium]|nr:hypothetical protein [Gemmataceae bacterium]
LWMPTVVNGQVAIQLAKLTAAGFPATLLRSLVLGLVKDAVKESFITATDEAIIVDVQQLVRRQNLPIAVCFEVRAVSCVEGGIFAEAGWPPAAGR